MPRRFHAALPVLSSVGYFRMWFVRAFLACFVTLVGADTVVAQAITTNGTTNAISVYRGDSVTVGAGSGSTTTDWVGLYEVGAANGSYRDCGT